MFPVFGENRKTRSGIDRTGNETESECLKNGCNNFLQIRYIITFLDDVLECISSLLQKKWMEI